jgi:ABC-type nitrate/sulfonate/bicarbonate transport system ATPase subunit
LEDCALQLLEHKSTAALASQVQVIYLTVDPERDSAERLKQYLAAFDHPQADKKGVADHYAAMVGLKGFEGSYPHELSGGMLKRAELARAFAVKPEILYMDEPFSALDALTNLRMRNELLRILEEERHTVMLITHDVEEAIHLADRIMVLSPRPKKIQAIFKVDLPHPRKLTSPEVQELRVAILHELGVDRNAG